MADSLPSSLKGLKPVLTIAKQYEGKDPVVAYYMYMHAAQTGMAAKGDPTAKPFLLSIIEKMEALKKHADSEAVKSEVVGQAYLEEAAVKLFLKADNDDRSAIFNKNVIKAFYTSSFLFEALGQFGEPSDDVLQKQKYAKWKAAEIARCLKSGIQPTSGPPGGDDAEGLGFGGQPTVGYSGGDPAGGSGPPLSVYPPPSDSQGVPQMGYYPPPNQQQPQVGFSQPYPPPVGGVSVYPDPHDPSSQPVPKPRQHLPPQPVSVQPPSRSRSDLTYVEFQQAAKLARHAASALDYEDVTTAVSNLSKALNLLQTGKEN